MIYPAIGDLMEKFKSRYSLVIGVAKRAREIYQTGVTFTECKSTKPVTVAVNEIAENKVSFKETADQDEIISDEEVYNKILEESLRD